MTAPTNVHNATEVQTNNYQNYHTQLESLPYQGYDDSNHAVNRSDLSTDLEIDTINPLVLSVSFRNKSYSLLYIFTKYL